MAFAEQYVLFFICVFLFNLAAGRWLACKPTQTTMHTQYSIFFALPYKLMVPLHVFAGIVVART